MSAGAGIALALLSSFALNWGWLAQHTATRSLPPLELRTPIRSLRSLFADRAWLLGFTIGLAGWALYVAALAFAELSLVQAVSAGGIGVLALLVHRRGDRLTAVQWTASAVAVTGLILLGVSLVGGDATGRAGSASSLAGWLVLSVAAATAAGCSGRWLVGGAGLGLAAGTLYATGDVATKAATFGGSRLALVPVVLAAHGLAFAVLQLGFQRGQALATVGTATLATNALPIVGGVTLFHERLPGGVLGDLRLVAFACVVSSAALLARAEP